MGPSTVPWGTPLFTDDQSEKTLPNLTRCLLPDKKSITQFIRLLRYEEINILISNKNIDYIEL
jgi:hypothetical protein